MIHIMKIDASSTRRCHPFVSVPNFNDHAMSPASMATKARPERRCCPGVSSSSSDISSTEQWLLNLCWLMISWRIILPNILKIVRIQGLYYPIY